MSMYPTGYSPMKAQYNPALPQTTQQTSMLQPQIRQTSSVPVPTPAPATTSYTSYTPQATQSYQIPQFSDITTWLDNYMKTKNQQVTTPVASAGTDYSAYRGTNYTPVTQTGSSFMSGRQMENPLLMALARLGMY
jgi:hypothetical protein